MKKLKFFSGLKRLLSSAKPLEHQRLALSLPNEIRLRTREIGKNRYPLLIADNFFADPGYLVELSRSLEFRNPDGKHIHARAILKAPTQKIHRFIYEHYAKDWVNTESQLRGRDGELRFFRSLPASKELPTWREDPHADGSFMLAGICYLTKPEYCRGGTGFFRHRSTGAEEKPPSVGWLKQRRVLPKALRRLEDLSVFQNFEESEFGNYESYLAQLPGKTHDNKYHLSGSNEIWKMTDLVEMKFNRFVMYPAFLLHKAVFEEEWFGSDLEQRRLTINFFFKFPRLDKSIFEGSQSQFGVQRAPEEQ